MNIRRHYFFLAATTALTVFACSFFPSPVHADDLNVDLIVIGCNNNTICEANSGEDFTSCPNDCNCNNDTICEPSSGEDISNCPADCTPVATSTPPTGATGGSGSGQTTGGSTAPTRKVITLDYLQVTTSENSVSINWTSNVPTQDTLSWGETSDYELGNLAEIGYVKEHHAELTDLEPSTHYQVLINLKDADGNFITRILSFNTNTPPELHTLYDVEKLTAVSKPDGIQLSWVNPADPDLSSVRVMRSEKTFPRNSSSDDLVYEGKGQAFLDKNVVAGKTYFYSVFAKNNLGKTSNGAVVMLQYKKSGVSPLDSDVGVSVGPGAPVYQYPDSMIWQEGLRYVKFKQNDKSISFLQNRVIVNGKFETVISMSGDATLNRKSTVLIYLYDGKGLLPSDIYTLSRNADTETFEVTLKPFLKSRLIPFKIFIADTDGSKRRIEGVFEVRGTGTMLDDAAGIRKSLSDTYTFAAPYAGFAFVIAIPFILWFLLYFIRFIAKKEQEKDTDK